MKCSIDQVVDLFNKTDKPFLTVSYVEQELGIKLLQTEVCRMANDHTPLNWCTLVTHERGFLRKAQPRYAKQAKLNIPHIQFANGEFENRFDFGGCAYVIFKDSEAYDNLIKQY